VIPQAVVSESNGEISCSVEESNRIRAMLGLKPLKTDDGGETSAEAVAVQNFRDKAEEDQKYVHEGPMWWFSACVVHVLSCVVLYCVVHVADV